MCGIRVKALITNMVQVWRPVLSLRSFLSIVLFALYAGESPLVRAQQAQDTTQTRREIIPGSELMSPQERERYRQRIRRAKSPEDETRICDEHGRTMRERARLRGLRLPEETQSAEGAK